MILALIVLTLEVEFVIFLRLVWKVLIERLHIIDTIRPVFGLS